MLGHGGFSGNSGFVGPPVNVPAFKSEVWSTVALAVA